MTSTAMLVALTCSATVLAACVPAFGADPRFATYSGAGPQGAATTTPPPAGPPPLAAPKNDLSWHDCTSRVYSNAGIPAAPGVKLECASYDTDLDPLVGGSTAVSIGVVRARSNQTPSDAGPLVFTTGSDLPSSTQLPVWLAHAGIDVLRSHPIVAVDRRGMGMSSPIDCRDHFDRDEMRDQAQFQAGDDPVANLSDISNTATTDCTDAIAPGESAYDNTHAASDIERLRKLWDVPALAFVGIGNGTQVALAYAASRPDNVARLILDSPIALGVSAEAAAEQQVQGQQAALDAFAAQCVAVNCALGSDPKGAVSALLSAARSGDGPGARPPGRPAHPPPQRDNRTKRHLLASRSITHHLRVGPHRNYSCHPHECLPGSARVAADAWPVTSSPTMAALPPPPPQPGIDCRAAA